jgi:hypothetical protein
MLFAEARQDAIGTSTKRTWTSRACRIVFASLAKLGLQTKSMTPREFAAKLADEARDWEAAVTESGVKID